MVSNYRICANYIFNYKGFYVKLLGLFMLVFALYFSWGLFNGKGALVPEGIHIEIQQSLSKKIIDVIIAAHPEAYNIDVSDFWTESLDDKSVEANFEFSFEEKNAEGEEAKVSKKGRAVVSKIKEEKGRQFWEATDVSLEGQRIEFKEGLTFSASDKEEAN